jgi:hypothetical protein
MRTGRSDRSGDRSHWLVRLERASDLVAANGLEPAIPTCRIVVPKWMAEALCGQPSSASTASPSPPSGAIADTLQPTIRSIAGRFTHDRSGMLDVTT